ncbi:MAG: hypothetical protein AB8G95_20660 [Anaerolineae bacterium]
MAHVFLDPKQYWLKRWMTLSEMIIDGIGAFDLGGRDPDLDQDESVAPDDFEVRAELSQPHELVRNAIFDLAHFADTLFYFFYEGYFDVNLDDEFNDRFEDVELREALEQLNREKNLFENPETSADSVLHVLLRQVQIDILRLQQSFFVHSEMGQQLYNLSAPQLLATILAEHTLRPNGDGSFLDFQFENTSIMIFPNDMIKVRLLPYVDALLIGLPLSAYVDDIETGNDEYVLDLSADFLALSHEAGHLVFQSGIIPHHLQQTFEGKRCARLGSHLHLKLPIWLEAEGFNAAENQWAAEWLIEIFCDVYGALVDGPVFAVGFQQLMASDRMEEIHTSDGHHPIPVLRPLLQNLVMLRISECLDEDGNSHFGWPDWVGDVADELVNLWGKVVKRNWPQWFNERGGVSYADDDLGMVLANATYEVDGVERTGEEILIVLDVAIKLILQTLNELDFRPQPGAWSQLDLSGQDGPEAIAEKLFLQYLKESQERIEASNQYTESFSFEALAASNNSSQVIKMLSENVDAIGSDKDLAKLIMTSGWEDEGPRTGGLGGWP